MYILFGFLADKASSGTFRLRLRLMNVGAPPAPEPGAAGVHTGVSPVLAQVFTKPFTVFSAKRFPGVPGECSVLFVMLEVHDSRNGVGGMVFTKSVELSLLGIDEVVLSPSVCRP